jgi:hypothetical protein
LAPARINAGTPPCALRESRRGRQRRRIFGTLLGSVPNIRAKTNGVVIYKGYVVAEFGDNTWVDPTYSVAKRMLATVMGIAVRDSKITNVDDPVDNLVKDGGYNWRVCPPTRFQRTAPAATP